LGLPYRGSWLAALAVGSPWTSLSTHKTAPQRVFKCLFYMGIFGGLASHGTQKPENRAFWDQNMMTCSPFAQIKASMRTPT
jgi:hypothetical protein